MKKNSSIFSAKHSALLVIGVFLFFVSGCRISENFFSQWDNRKNAEKLRVGMTKAEVVGIMGEPLEEQFNTKDVLYFYIRTTWHDLQPTVDETLPVVFRNNKVIGFGEDFYKNHVLFHLKN